ncbi:MAG: DUF397 domain-containing protein [Pseudonocardiaceae bacterium]
MINDLTPAMWRKSTFSNAEAACVEIADLPNGTRAVRDSKNRLDRLLRSRSPSGGPSCVTYPPATDQQYPNGPCSLEWGPFHMCH